MDRPTLRLPADQGGIARTVAMLRAGGLVAFPTETVYGLGADATQGQAVAAIYAAKGRPQFNPLIAHVASREAALAEGDFDRSARVLAEAFWPGPLTLVVPTTPRTTVCDLARAGLDSIGLRVPDHPVALAILVGAAVPIAAPSANRSGRISPTTADHVAADLAGRVDAIVDGGPTAVGVESTIVACLEAGPTLLRPGGVPREAIEAVLGHAIGVSGSGGALLAPGMMASHYAPSARVRLNAVEARADEVVLDFAGRLHSAAAAHALDLSPSGNLNEAAANLFGYLRRLDRSGSTCIAVAPIPTTGLGEAINDRLARAAAPR